MLLAWLVGYWGSPFRVTRPRSLTKLYADPLKSSAPPRSDLLVVPDLFKVSQNVSLWSSRKTCVELPFDKALATVLLEMDSRGATGSPHSWPRLWDSIQGQPSKKKQSLQHFFLQRSIKVKYGRSDPAHKIHMSFSLVLTTSVVEAHHTLPAQSDYGALRDWDWSKMSSFHGELMTCFKMRGCGAMHLEVKRPQPQPQPQPQPADLSKAGIALESAKDAEPEGSPSCGKLKMCQLHHPVLPDQSERSHERPEDPVARSLLKDIEKYECFRFRIGSVNGPATELCRLVVRAAVLVLFLVNVIAIPYAIVIRKFLENNCGDFIDTEDFDAIAHVQEQFDVDCYTDSRYSISDSFVAGPFMSELAALRSELEAIRESCSQLLARVDRVPQLVERGDFELVGGDTSEARSSAETGTGTQTGGPASRYSTAEREEAARQTGEFFLRSFGAAPGRFG
eukprot:Skav225690  [mRNA]  locus=scaffold2526:76650:82180:- [translate_table: standard]